MPLKNVVKISRKTFFNPKGWFGYDFLVAQLRITRDLLKDIYTPAEAKRQETFEQAMVRLKLSEKDIKEREKNFLLYAIILASVSVVVFIFSCYLLIHHGTLSGMILGLVSTILLLVYAFRYHFWYFQIKQRKLGCTFDEWLQSIVPFGKERKP